MNRGIFYAFSAYLVWGLSPLYWKQVQHVSALEIVGSRVFWTFLFVLAVLTVRKHWSWRHRLHQDRRMFYSLGVAAVLLAINWLVYVGAVNGGFVVEASLGYFITPLVTVLLGVIILRERLRPWQWAAVALAAAGVLYLTIVYGSLPWISLALAFSFGLYGFMKKKGRLPVLESLGVEMAWLLIPALILMAMLEFRGTGRVWATPPPMPTSF